MKIVPPLLCHCAEQSDVAISSWMYRNTKKVRHQVVIPAEQRVCDVGNPQYNRLTPLFSIVYYSNVNDKVTRVLLFLLCCVLCYLSFLFIKTKISIISYPYGMENGEGFVLYTTALYQKGMLPYGSIAHSPYWVNNYPPVYNLICMAIGWICKAQLAVGRMVSGISLFGIGVALFLCMRRLTRTSVWSGICGMLFIAQPFLFWSAFYRVDYLAVFFSVCGVVWFLYALTTNRYWWVSILFFVLGIYTKHSTLAAPGAAVITLLCIRNKRWWIYTASLIAGCLLPGMMLQYVTDGGFLRHLFYYTATSFSRFGINLIIRNYGLLLVFTLVSITGCAWVMVKKQFSAFSIFIAVYFILNVCGLSLLFKEGASSLYMIEYAFAIILAGGFFTHQLQRAYSAQIKMVIVSALCISVVWTWCVGNPSRMQVVYQFKHTLQSMLIRDNEIYRKVSSTPGRVLCEDVSFPVLCGKSPEWNPFMLKQLHQRGIFPDTIIRREIRDKKFDLVLLEFELKPVNGEVPVPGLQMLRFSPGLMSEIFSAYKIVPLESYVPVQPIPKTDRKTILYPR